MMGTPTYHMLTAQHLLDWDLIKMRGAFVSEWEFVHSVTLDCMTAGLNKGKLQTESVRIIMRIW